MPPIEFRHDEIDWNALICNEESGYWGKGAGRFVGTPYQRGRGLGSAVRALRHLVPGFLNSTPGHELVNSGIRIMGDVARGENAVKTLEKHGRQVVKTLTGQGGRKRKQPVAFVQKRIKQSPRRINFIPQI